MSFVQNLKKTYPKSFYYFEIFYNENYTISLSIEQFIELSFMFQLGVYIQFFNSVSTDVDVYSIEEEALKDSIKEAFAQYEEYLFLDS